MFTLKMEDIRSCTTLITTYKTAWHRNTKDHNGLFHGDETFTSHRILQDVSISKKLFPDHGVL